MNIQEFPLVLAAAEAANDTVIVESLHGIGKSDSIKQFATSKSYHLEELFLSMMDTGDLIGIPRTKQVGTSTITAWAEPDWFQRITDAAFPQIVRISDLAFTDTVFGEHLHSSFKHEEITRTELNTIYSHFYDLADDTLHLVQQHSTVRCSKSRKSVLFLDELNRSNLDVRQASLQLVLNKEIHCHKLPYVNGEPTFIVAAINPSDIYQVDELDAALLNRFCHVTLEANTKSFLTWGRDTKINQIVLDYLAENPTRLHWQPADGGIGATPRSWAKLATYMDRIDSIPPEVRFTIMKGKLGAEIGAQFLSFFNNYSKVVKVEDIEALVAKQLKKSTNPEVIAKAIEKLISKQEAIQQSQLAELLYAKYIIADNKAIDTMPAIAFFYALPIEGLASLLKSKRNTDQATYLKLAEFDNELNGKKLFTKITAKVK
jgi:hypothetical protein